MMMMITFVFKKHIFVRFEDVIFLASYKCSTMLKGAILEARKIFWATGYIS